MSRETTEWLNNNVLVGFEQTRGKAWHYEAEAQGDQPNHYPLSVPVADVRSRLFHWNVVELEATYPWVDSEGNLDVKSTGQKHLVRSDTGDHLATMGKDYQVHDYSSWLIDNVLALLDVSEGELGIGSAGLLMNGAVAWVQVERPESVTIGGDELRPFLVATTSHNGKFATSYKAGTTRVVCDNTLDMFHGEKNKGWRAKHTKNSGLRIAEAREMLELAFKAHDDEFALIDQLMNQSVSDAQFWTIVDKLDPLPKDQSSKGFTVVKNKRNKLEVLWQTDPMVKEFRGTAWGMVQTYNTFDQHHARLRGVLRPERNQLNFLSGKTGESDHRVLAALTSV